MTRNFVSFKGGIAMRHIKVKYQNNNYDFVPDYMLDQLISARKIKKFYRFSEERWVTAGFDRIRGIGGIYSGPDRRWGRFFVKDEELGKKKFDIVEELVLELREMQDLLSDRENIKVEYEKEITQRFLIEQESQKIRTSLEEQLADRGAEMVRIRAELQHEVGERQRIEEELRTITTSFEEQLAERAAEMDRIRAERQLEVQEWKQILDNLGNRLINSKF